MDFSICSINHFMSSAENQCRQLLSLVVGQFKCSAVLSKIKLGLHKVILKISLYPINPSIDYGFTDLHFTVPSFT
jgi:hypothetical protein